MNKFSPFPQLRYDLPGRMYHPDEWCAHCGRPFRKHATRAQAAEHIARVVASERGVAFDPKLVGDIRDIKEDAYSQWRKTAAATPAGQPGSLGKTPAVPPTEGSLQHGFQHTGLPRPEEPRWTAIQGRRETATAQKTPTKKPAGSDPHWIVDPYWITDEPAKPRKQSVYHVDVPKEEKKNAD